ncbi:hypothetical protein [Stenotrophomonas nematodicola]|uniref:hypothetical protein n=1 Tax=Stenotrophomonas nematodicola TaxID=2656746 RepID=UPI003D9A2171
MKIANLHRLALALAAMGLARTDLRRLLHELRSVDDDEFLRLISILSDPDQAQMELHSPYPTSKSRRATQGHSVGTRVEQLLKTEAKLTNARAYELMKDAIIRHGLMAPSEVPTLSKKSISSWTERLLPRIQEKEVLRIATLIRNEFAHSPVADWNLHKGRVSDE